jgi:ABC-type iron transport system FetAB ATPase subunit
VYNLSAVDDSGAKLLEKATLTLAPGERLAVAGAAGSGGDALAEALVGLVTPDNGRVTLGGNDIAMTGLTMRRPALPTRKSFPPPSSERSTWPAYHKMSSISD